MPNSLLTLIEQHLGANLVPRLRQQIIGVAQDFWKDGNENPLILKWGHQKKHSSSMSAPSPSATQDESYKTANNLANGKLWHAAPAELSERMWGDGFVTPGGPYIADMLIKPIGLTKDMNVLDLSAGLGGRIRKITSEYGSYVTGLEPDPGVAKRGMELSVRAGKAKHASIEHYEPEKLELSRHYDCVIARETFYRVKDKERLFKTIGSNMKPRAHLTFTDYIVNPEDREKPAVLGWCKFEPLAAPIGLIEISEAWSKVGVKLRINEDLSDYYKKEVAKGLQRLAIFLGTGVTPDPETKAALRKRIETWTHRLSAMEQGMKFYRFYGTKM